jgi:hypothetical protein
VSQRVCTFTNGYGTSLVLGNNDYIIEKAEGFGVPPVAVYQQKSPYQDGTSYIDALYEPRTIVLQCAYGQTNNNISLINQQRALVSNVFNAKHGEGLFLYNYASGSKQIYGLPKLNMPDKPFGQFWKFQLTIECFDPYWQEVTESSSTMAIVEPLWEFPFEMKLLSTILATGWHR